MKKTSFKAFLAGAMIACLTLCITACGGEKESPAKDFVAHEINGEVTISGYKSETTDIIVPKKIKGKPVTTISDGAFNGLKFVTSIKLHDGIKKIGKGSFAGCEQITSIVVPEGITEIGDNTFRDCEKLESITLPSTLKSIGKNAFKACKSLKEINIPEGVESIGEAAFLDCHSLSKVYLPSSVNSIGLQAFFNIQNLEITMKASSSFCLTRMNKDFSVKLIGNCTQDQIYEINKNMKNISNDIAVILDMKDVSDLDIIAEETFDRNKKLIQVILPESIKKIDEWAFGNCIKLQDIVLNEGLLEIEDSAFSHCESLKSILIPDSVVSIKDTAFYSCESLENITIGSGVEKIGIDAFSYCSSLKTITLPANIKEVCDYAFDETGLKTVNYCGPKEHLKIGAYAFPRGVTINYDYTGE